jgi:hypothetical protein
MNVRLAAQILSNSVTTGFKYYRERENTKESFEGNLTHILFIKRHKKLNHISVTDTEGTEEMVSYVNDAFDVMNGRCYIYSIRRSTWRKDRQVLIKFELILL